MSKQGKKNTRTIIWSAIGGNALVSCILFWIWFAHKYIPLQ